MKSFLLFLLIGLTSLPANDCVPLTFTTLSSMVGESKPYAQWKELTMPDGVSPTIQEAVSVWNANQNHSFLSCIYSIIPDLPFKDHGIRYDVPYVWVGLPNPDMILPGEGAGAHAAIAVFKESGVSLIHTMDPETQFEERLSLDEFMSRTLAMFRVERLPVFIHFETLGEVIIIQRE